MIVQSWDTANKATELSDYSVCTTWGVKDQRMYPDWVGFVTNCSSLAEEGHF